MFDSFGELVFDSYCINCGEDLEELDDCCINCGKNVCMEETCSRQCIDCARYDPDKSRICIDCMCECGEHCKECSLSQHRYGMQKKKTCN